MTGLYQHKIYRLEGKSNSVFVYSRIPSFSFRFDTFSDDTNQLSFVVYIFIDFHFWDPLFPYTNWFFSS